MAAVILAEWTAHPARRRPHDIALVAMVTLVFCGAVLASLQSVWLTVLAAIILVIATAPFLFPTRYRLTDEGVYERRLGRERGRRWSELRRYQVGTGAALVSPFRRPSMLERYRGLILYLDGSDRRAIEAILAERIGEAGEESDELAGGEPDERPAGEPDEPPAGEDTTAGTELAP